MDVLDWVGRKMPHLYFSSRTLFLSLTIIFTVVWFAYGYDSTIEYTFSGEHYGTGFHWSTLQTFSLFMYLCLINLQAGGLRSGRQVWACVKQDVKGSLFIHRIRSIRREPHYTEYVVEPLRALIVSFFACLLALFVFENIWVLLYNYFHFGSWVWPIYYAEGNPNLILGAFKIPVPLTAQVFWRNVGLMFVSLALCVLPFAKVDKVGAGFEWRYRVKPRLNVKALWLAYLAGVAWIMWIYYPSAIFPQLHELNLEETIGIATSMGWDRLGAFIYPVGGLFPQTTYTFYRSSLWMQVYPLESVLGFHVVDDGVHTLNLIVKNLVFVAVCYPFMYLVKRRKDEL